jgi:hypothetical protein
VKRLRTLRRIAFFLALVACGSRTGLFGEDSFTGALEDGGPQAIADASADAIGAIDARPRADVDRRDCPDAEALLVYTIGTITTVTAGTVSTLRSFDPSTGQFREIGRIDCPGAREDTPFSMAVDRQGIAYILFRSERLFRVSTATGRCLSTAYVPRQSNFGLFGMGFATNAAGPTETLYVAGEGTQNNGGATGLARISPTTFALTPVGEFSPPIDQAELTGTGDGRLFAFYEKQPNSRTSYIGEIDPQTARVLGERRFNGLDQGLGWAFAYWGGDFYMFHAPTGSTRVTRWRPSDDSVVQVATTTEIIVGAGVSTCAPQQ